MQIRTMSIMDYDQVYSLWLSCRGMGLNDVDDSREGIARFLDRNPDTCFVAEQDRQIIGVILAGSDGRRGYIHHMAVGEAFRRQGVGRMLVDAALDALRSCGISKAALVVFARNKAGNRFWEKMGFEERTDLVYRDRTLVEMRRIDT